MRNLFWFRRDLRVEDNIGLYNALKESSEVIPLFILEPEMINSIDTGSAKIYFLFDSIKKLSEYFRQINSKLIIRFGEPSAEISKIIVEQDIKTVYFNKAYEDSEMIRDERVIHTLNKADIKVKSFDDQNIFNANEIEVSSDFNEYKSKWQKKIRTKDYKIIENEEMDLTKFISYKNEILSLGVPNPMDYNFKLQTKYKIAGEEQAKKILNKVFKDKKFNYSNKYFDFYSFISPYLRFGNISVRQIIKKVYLVKKFADSHDKKLLSEIIENIIKKEYYSNLFLTRVIKSENLNSEQTLELNKNYKNFFIWCNGETGYPIIDAAMKQLNQEGILNTNLRSVVSAFLVNVLKVDRKWGERYFMHKLITSENHFESYEWKNINKEDINIIELSKKFDKEGDFIRKYISALKVIPDKYVHEPYKIPFNLQKRIKFIIGRDYPFPIIAIKNNIEKIDIIINDLEENK